MYNYIFKICVFGDYNTGKTSFLNCLQEFDYVKTYEATIGVEYSSKIFNLKDGKQVKVTFWDCAGQERFNTVTESFFRKVPVEQPRSYTFVFSFKKKSDNFNEISWDQSYNGTDFLI